MTGVKEARESMMAAVDAMEAACDHLKDAVEALEGMDDRDAVAMREACLYAWARLPVQPVEAAAERGRRRKA